MAETAEKMNVTALRKPETAREGTVKEAPARQQAAPPAPAARRGRRGLVRWTLLLGGPLLLAIVVGWFWLAGGRYVGTDNAYIQADMVNVATDVAGLVRTVEVGDNQRVARGQTLFTLDDSTYRNALAQAEAGVRLAASDLEALKASYAQKQAEIVRARDDVAFYEKEFGRQQDLAARRVAPQSQLDAAQHNLDSARSSVAALEQELAGISAQLDSDPNAPVEQHPRYKSAVAARDQAARNLDHAVVKAPMDGITARVPSLQPGEYLPAGQAAFALIATDHVWVEANPKETQLTTVMPDQPVEVTVDTYPGRTWHGTVASLSPASQSSFSLLPAQNASGNWVKVVQRIPLRVRVDTKPDEPQLRAGMSAEIEVDTGRQRHLRDLLPAWLG